MSRRVDPPTPANALRELRRDVRKLERQPGRWIYFGTGPLSSDESPPFKNGFSNPGGDFVPFRFRVNKWRVVEVEGTPAGGALGDVIGTLPVGYRPDYSLRFVCASDTEVPSVIQVDPNGDITQVS